MKAKKEEQFYKAVRFAFLAVVGAALVAAVWYCFNELLKPKDAPHSDTLVGISNSYEKDETQKGDIFDSNGNLLMSNVALDKETGEPVMLDGSYQRYAELSEEERGDYIRLLWNDEQAEYWSNILPALSGGLDSDFASVLQDIPLNSEEESDVILTIDSNVQVDAYRSLADRKYSSAVVMNCNTGDVLAMASTPSYDYNAYRFGSIPFTVYFTEKNKFHNNTDNTYDCVQDYYTKWKVGYQTDNAEVTNSSSFTAGEAVREWENEKEELGMLLTEKEAREVLSSWNSSYGMEMTLENCYEVNFEEIYKQEYAFEQEEQRKYEEAKKKNETYAMAGFQFNYEPDGLGDGESYIPFVRYITANEEEARYLLLRYGSNNFVYEDCVTYGFDPNFSFSNQVLDRSQPGSCFKILLSAQLLDQASENLMTTSGVYGITTLNISNEYLARMVGAEGMPTAETSEQEHTSLIHAMDKSSNHYFAMAAMLLDPILRTEESSYRSTYDLIRKAEPETLLNSAERMQNYYEAKFCINQEMETLFSVPRSKILGCLNTIRIEKSMFENRDEKDNIYYYDDSLCYEILPDDKLGQAYTDSSISLIKKIGDTAYGQGYNMITPMFMAQTIGKCLTGEMYVPNVLQDVSIEPEVVGEPFDREQQTVKNMQDHLRVVYNGHNSYIPDGLSFPSDAFTFYSKTGTSSAEVSCGTQSTYGLFANSANYPLNNEGDYQMIWYVGGVSDGTNCYAIVLRSYFDNDSYSLQKEFLTIVDSLYRNGYLKN